MTGDEEPTDGRAKSWRVTGSRFIHRDRWVSLRADDCLTADGVEIAPYYVLEYPDWVNVVALDQEANVVLIRQYRHGLGRTSLELPCGAIEEKKDAGPAAAALRELLEETGYGGAARVSVIGTLSPNPATHTNLIHTVLAEGVSAVQSPRPEPAKILAIEVMPWRKALDLALSGAVIQSSHVASLVLAFAAAGKITLP